MFLLRYDFERFLKQTSIWYDYITLVEMVEEFNFIYLEATDLIYDVRQGAGPEEIDEVEREIHDEKLMMEMLLADIIKFYCENNGYAAQGGK